MVTFKYMIILNYTEKRKEIKDKFYNNQDLQFDELNKVKF